MSFDYRDPIQNVTPNGRILFFKGLGLDPSNENTFYFATKSRQTSFFESKASETIIFANGTTDNPVMVIKSPFVRTFAIPANSAELFEYDYVQVVPDVNSEGTMGKPLYMFITGVSFINHFTALLTCELDVIQTFMFDWDLGEQSVEQMHSQEIYDKFSDSMKTSEAFTPSPTETVSTKVLSKGQTNSSGYLVVATEAPSHITTAGDWRFYGPSASDVFYKDTYPVGNRDGSQYVYVYCGPGSLTVGGKVIQYTAEETLDQLLTVYADEDKLNAVYKVYSCPPLVSGADARDDNIQWIGGKKFAGAFTDYDKTFPGCIPVVSDVVKAITDIAVPENFYGYVPMDTKTFNLFTLEVLSPMGQAFTLNTDQIFTEKVRLVVAGVFNAEPEIICYPAIFDTTGTFGIPSNLFGGVKDYTAPSVSLGQFQSCYVLNKDALEAFYRHEAASAITGIVGAVTKLAGFI